jgi:hypothetical protein
MSSLDSEMSPGELSYRIVQPDSGLLPWKNSRLGRGVGAKAHSGLPDFSGEKCSCLAEFSGPAFNVRMAVADETALTVHYYVTNERNAQYFRQGIAVEGDHHSSRVNFGDNSSLTVSAQEIAMSGRTCKSGRYLHIFRCRG